MGSSKRNLLTSILLLVVMGVFAVLTIFIVVDAINKKYYNDIKVEYEVQEESPNIILTFARNEGSKFSTDNTKVMLNEDKTKFRIDGTVPTIENGVVTNLDDLTSSDGREFYFFSKNSSFIDPQEDPENPNFIFSESDYRYYVSTEDNPIWYDVPKSSENLTLYSVFLTPNVHNSDFANAPLLNTSPNVIISHDVVDIPYNAFSNALMEGDLSMAAKIESVVIPNSTKSINSEVDINAQIIGGAFAACTTLTNVLIPSSVEYVGGEAFMLCSGLDTVEYGNGYYLPTESNEHAILIDTNLKAEDVTIHEACISIQGGAFSKFLFVNLGLIPPPEPGESEDYINMNLQKITIPKNVKNIGIGAFMSCIGLTNVVFEEDSDLTSIGYGSFGACSSLKTINLEATKLEELTGSFDDCSSLTSITIPESVTSIGDSTFSDCRSLTSITIPDSVTSIGIYAFEDCRSLKTVTFGENSQLTSIGSYTFYGCYSLTSITIPSGVTSIGDYAFRYCYKLVEVYDLTGSEGLNITAGNWSNGYVGYYADYVYTNKEIDLLQKAVGDYTFYYNNGIMYLLSYSGSEKELNLPSVDKVKEEFKDFSGDTYEIREYAFYENTNIASVIIPNCVTSIGYSAFYNCSSLKTVTFGENSQLTSIGSYTFYGCSSLTSITIPESVTSIGNSAFEDCSSLTSITIPDSVTSIGERTFYGCSSLTSITIPDSVTSIGSFAFYYCDGLTSITIPDSVKRIGNYAFEYCKSLTSITIPDSVTIIGYSAFENCSSLTSITIPDSVTSIGESTFEGCSSLTSITIPDSVTSIGNYAFRNCSSLTSITILDSVTSIGNSAFRYCDKLTIYCEASSQPSGWSSSWNGSNRPVYWAGEWEMVDGVPEPKE